MTCPFCDSRNVRSTLVGYSGRDENKCTCDDCGMQWVWWTAEHIRALRTKGEKK